MNATTTQPSTLPWNRPGWLAEVSRWIDDRLAKHGRQARGPLQIVHQRPWSAFARVPTDQGTVYFKAPAPVNVYEAALTRALARWRPDCTVPLLGVDVRRGWLLSADAGETLRSLTRSPEQLAHWLTVLPLYATLQIDLADRLTKMLALRVPDRRLAQLPQQYADLLRDTESLLLGLHSGLTHEEHRRLHALQDAVADLCRRLDDYRLPQTLVHEEIHENNVIAANGRYTFTDWSDCCVGHPFFSMLVTERTLVHWLRLDADGAEVQRARDAYLEPWTSYATRAELSDALSLAYRLGMINRALSWRAGLATLPEKDKVDYADSVAGWLQDFLQAMTNGPA